MFRLNPSQSYEIICDIVNRNKKGATVWIIRDRNHLISSLRSPWPDIESQDNAFGFLTADLSRHRTSRQSSQTAHQPHNRYESEANQRIFLRFRSISIRFIF